MSYRNDQGLKDECHDPNCGHERDSHHHDEEGIWNCLALRCECRKFRATAPLKQRGPVTYLEEKMSLAKPHADTACRCGTCVDWERKRWAGVYP